LFIFLLGLSPAATYSSVPTSGSILAKCRKCSESMRRWSTGYVPSKLRP